MGYYDQDWDYGDPKYQEEHDLVRERDEAWKRIRCIDDDFRYMGDCIENIVKMLSSPGLLNKECLIHEFNEILDMCGREKVKTNLLIKRECFVDAPDEFFENMNAISTSNMNKLLRESGIQL
jgi:hypothetical protein